MFLQKAGETMTNSEMLRDIIDKSGYRVHFIAKTTGICYQAFLNKINNVTEFKASEISALCDLLKIQGIDKEKIFFAASVDL